MNFDKISVAICNNDPLFSEDLRKLILRCIFEYDFIESIKIVEPKELTSNSDYDVIFLDVEMSQINGFTLAYIIMKNKPQTKIVFVTNHKDYVQEAFKVKAFCYLFKPATQLEVKEVLEYAFHDLTKVEGTLITRKDSVAYVRFADIYYIESLGEQTAVYNDCKYTLTRRTLRAWQNELQVRQFFRVHKSYIVNLAHVVKVDKGKTILDNMKVIPLSTRNYSSAKNAFRLFVKENSR